MAAQVQVQIMQRTNGTADQWQRALQRAISEALDVLIEPVSGEAFVESANHPGILYAVSRTTCTCKAGARGIPCKHVACYRAQIGELALDPEPAPAAPAPAAIDCRACNGCGVVYSRSGGWRCEYCHGAGQVAAYPRRIAA